MPNEVKASLPEPSGRPPSEPIEKTRRETKAAREQRERAEKLQPVIQRLAAAAAERFRDELTRCLDGSGGSRPNKHDRQRILGEAWRYLPRGIGGAVIAKHFKTGDTWTIDDVIAGIESLTCFVRSSQRPESDPRALIFGAIECLIDAGKSAKSGKKQRRGDPELAIALIKLHQAILQVHSELTAWTDGCDVKTWLPLALAIMVRNGGPFTDPKFDFQKPFGLTLHPDFLISVWPSGTVAPPSQINPNGGPRVNSSGGECTGSRDGQPPAKAVPPPATLVILPPDKLPAPEVQKLKGEVRALKDELAARSAEVSRLRSAITNAQDAEERAREQYRTLVNDRDALSERSSRLRSELEQAQSQLEEARLKVSSLCTLAVELDRLKAALVQAETQNEQAKSREFSRGQQVMRSQIAAYLSEGLGQMIMATDALPGERALLIRELARDFQSYLHHRG
jgi:hypothetical protein